LLTISRSTPTPLPCPALPRPPPTTTLFPYTTLFRSNHNGEYEGRDESASPPTRSRTHLHVTSGVGGTTASLGLRRSREDEFVTRSEEHTSELQSLRHLVCRLLLEKKK